MDEAEAVAVALQDTEAAFPAAFAVIAVDRPVMGGERSAPLGKGKAFLNKSGLVNQLAGGWQISGLFRFRSGLPSVLTFGGVYPTNYLNSALGILKDGATNPNTGTGFNAVGNPTIFPGLKAGDAVEVSLEGVGALRVTVKDPP